MSKSVACCGLITSLLGVIVAVLTLFAAVTSKWVVIETNAALGNQSTTIDFGMTHICVNHECRKHEYTPPAGCKRSAGDFNERVGAVEGFIILGFIFSFLLALLVPYASLRSMQHEQTRECMRLDRSFATEERVQTLRLAEDVLKRRVIGSIVLTVVCIICIVASFALFLTAKGSYLFCTDLCTYMKAQMPDASCKLGWSYSAVLIALIVAGVMLLSAIAMVVIYMAGFGSLFDGIVTVSSADTGKSDHEPFSDAPKTSSDKQRKESASRKRPPDSPLRSAWNDTPDADAYSAPHSQTVEASRDSSANRKPAPRTTPQRRKETPPRRTPQRRNESPQRRQDNESNNSRNKNPLEFKQQVSSGSSDTFCHVLPEHKELIRNLQGDDWDYVEENQLYWSSKQGLYFDPNSMHFFDPDTDQWYDPDTEEWYSLEGGNDADDAQVEEL